MVAIRSKLKKAQGDSKKQIEAKKKEKKKQQKENKKPNTDVDAKDAQDNGGDGASQGGVAPRVKTKK